MTSFILAGQGTAAWEFLEEVPDLDCLLTPCSGWRLFAGVSTAAKALNPGIRWFCREPILRTTRVSRFSRRGAFLFHPRDDRDGLRVQSPVSDVPVLQKTAERCFDGLR